MSETLILSLNSSGLSRRRDGSHHERCVLVWAKSPILDWHIRPHVTHRKSLSTGGPSLRWTRFSFSELTRLSSKRDTASEHVVRQVVLSFASDSMSDWLRT